MTAAGFAAARLRRVLRRHRRGQDRRPPRGRDADLGARARGAGRAAPRAAALLDGPGRRARARAPALRGRRHAAHLLGRRRPVRRPRRRRRDAGLRPPRARDEVHRARGDGREHQARVRRAGQGLPLRLLPGVPQGGLRGARTSCEPDRVVIGDDGDWAGDAVEALYAPLGAPIVRTDVKSAEMVKLASNAFLATKISFINEIANVCEETGADVVEVARGMGLDDRIGPKFLQAGIGFGGSCFPKDVTALKQLAGNSRLPLPAAERGDRGQRAAEAARDRASCRSTSARSSARRSRCSGSPSSRNTDDMREASSLVLSARLQARGRARARVRPRGRGGGAQADPRRRARALGAPRRSRAPTPSCSSRSGRSSASSTWSDVAARDARHAGGRRAQLPRSAAARAAGLIYEAIGRPSPQSDGGGVAMQALILAGGEGTRLRPLTSTVPKPVVPLVDRPFIAFMLDWLRGHGVDDVSCRCGFLAVRRAQRARRRRRLRRSGCATSRSRTRSARAAR